MEFHGRHTWSLTSLCILRVDLEYIQQGLGPSLLVTTNLDVELKITPKKEIQQRGGKQGNRTSNCAEKSLHYKL
jgi:hypothetical protein